MKDGTILMIVSLLLIIVSLFYMQSLVGQDEFIESAGDCKHRCEIYVEAIEIRFGEVTDDVRRKLMGDCYVMNCLSKKSVEMMAEMARIAKEMK